MRYREREKHQEKIQILQKKRPWAVSNANLVKKCVQFIFGFYCFDLNEKVLKSYIFYFKSRVLTQKSADTVLPYFAKQNRPLANKII